MLLTVTVFLSRAFQAELSQPGFRTERILLTNFEPRLARYDAHADRGVLHAPQGAGARASRRHLRRHDVRDAV